MNHSSYFQGTSRSRLLPLSLLCVAAFALGACGKNDREAAKAAATPAKPGVAQGLETNEQKVSYGIGYNFGSSISKQNDFAADRNALKAGLEDALAGTKTRISEADLQAAFNAVRERVAAASAAAGEKNLATGAAYLAKNKARAGVTTTGTGLQYEVLTKGTGPKPKATDTVVVHYHGTLIDGTVFDSSVERGEPASFTVGGVIKGWVEALQLMSVGDKWKLYIPADLAYGPRAAGKIPPNSTLIFEVQLLSINPK